MKLERLNNEMLITYWRKTTNRVRKHQSWASFVRLYLIVRELDERKMFFEV
jgi:hypothetical protein